MLKHLTCPNHCSDGAIINTGPDPLYEPCQWCENIYMLEHGELAPLPEAPK